jgi:hypothetical protein
MTTQVNIVLSEAKDTLVVPSTALGAKDAQGRYTVRVLDAQGQAQPRKVRIGINTNAQVQIIEGLKAGERVVTGTATGRHRQQRASWPAAAHVRGAMSTPCCGCAHCAATSRPAMTPSPCSTTSTSTSTPARWWPSSASPARASRR